MQMNGRERNAAAEHPVLDAGHRLRNSCILKLFTVLKQVRADHSHRLRQRKTLQRGAGCKCHIADLGQILREGHLFKRGAAGEHSLVAAGTKLRDVPGKNNLLQSGAVRKDRISHRSHSIGNRKRFQSAAGKSKIADCSHRFRNAEGCH